MDIPKTRKQKHSLLLEILSQIQIDSSERELYILSLEILDDTSFEEFFIKIYSQVYDDGKLDSDLNKKTLAPLSSNIL